MSLQDIRFNLEDPTITRPKCDIGIRIFISDFMNSILGRIGRLGNGSGMVMIDIVVTVPVSVGVMFSHVVGLSLVSYIRGSHFDILGWS
jgi:hypothetical protein